MRVQVNNCLPGFLHISSFYSLLLFLNVIVGKSLLPSTQHQILCHDQEKHALLQFQQSFLIDCDASSPAYAYPKVMSWRENAENGSTLVDCCTWNGVECNEETGHVIGLDLSNSCLYGTFPPNSTLFTLAHLLELNLADNNFNNSPIPSSIDKLSKLTSLDLSFSNFAGQVPSQISRLSNLSFLDLSDSNEADDPSGLTLHGQSLDKLVRNLTRLSALYLSYVDISSVVPPILSNLTSLRFIYLSGCQLYGELPQGILELPLLEEVKLFDNVRLEGSLPEFQPNSHLRSVDLQYSGISGQLPASIGNLGRLEGLRLFGSNFYGPIPPSLGNLTKLTYLDLAENNFSGPLPSSLANLTKLDHLSLSGLDSSPKLLNSWFLRLNKLSWLTLTGMNMGNKIPTNLQNLTRLNTLSLSDNQLKGTLPPLFANLTRLTTLYLFNNQFEGPVPEWVFNLVLLENLALSSTNLVVMLEPFSKLKNLQRLYLGNTNLTIIHNNSINSSLAKLEVLDLSSCKLAEFPLFLRTQNELHELYLSSNHISGHIPQWFLNMSADSLQLLNLSYNSLTEFEDSVVFLPWTHLESLDLRGNLLQGSLPIPSKNIETYCVSNNQLSGVIPEQICQASSLEVLDLSNNNISGQIPDCISHASSLRILDLSNNKMSGQIPDCISHRLGESLVVLNLLGNNFHGIIPHMFSRSCTLKMINLSKNQLGGHLPRSLANCTMLEVFDVGDNHVNDTFPSWLGDLHGLQILVLRHNNFHGNIGNLKWRHGFGRLRIIDLSHNFHTGTLPSSYVQSWHAMANPNEDQSSSSQSKFKISYLINGQFSFTTQDYYYVITITNKRSDTYYSKILTVFRVIDFSSNHFSGEIPSSLGDLKGLQALNLSRNNFEKHIPSSLSKIRDLQSLDLSQNMLSGMIPQELATLTFLEVFDVSHNHLEGPIPQEGQFNTFDNSSFDGNLALCGAPLSNECGHSSALQSSPQLTDGGTEEDSELIDWIIRSSGCVSGFVVGLIIGKIYITDRHHSWFMDKFGRRRSNRRGRKAPRGRRH